MTHQPPHRGPCTKHPSLHPPPAKAHRLPYFHMVPPAHACRPRAVAAHRIEPRPILPPRGTALYQACSPLTPPPQWLKHCHRRRVANPFSAPPLSKTTTQGPQLPHRWPLVRAGGQTAVPPHWNRGRCHHHCCFSVSHTLQSSPSFFSTVSHSSLTSRCRGTLAGHRRWSTAAPTSLCHHAVASPLWWAATFPLLLGTLTVVQGCSIHRRFCTALLV
jgi:hypothetical protein